MEKEKQEAPLIDFHLKVRGFGVRKALRKYVSGSADSSKTAATADATSSETAIADITSSDRETAIADITSSETAIADTTSSETASTDTSSSTRPSSRVSKVLGFSSTTATLETAIKSISSSTLHSLTPSFGVKKVIAFSPIPDSKLETASEDTSSTASKDKSSTAIEDTSSSSSSSSSSTSSLTPFGVRKTLGSSSTSDFLEATSTDIPPPPPPSREFKYDVVLSFRGTDARNFSDHLYTALENRGIHTFRDDEELERGESIVPPNLLEAIEQSRYAVVVLSPGYVESSLCLDETAKIVACRETTGLKVLPVFYGVDPSDVQTQTGDHLKKAFDEHTTLYKDELLLTWRNALSEVGKLSGWELQDRYESQIIQKVGNKILEETTINSPINYPALEDCLN